MKTIFKLLIIILIVTFGYRYISTTYPDFMQETKGLWQKAKTDGEGLIEKVETTIDTYKEDGKAPEKIKVDTVKKVTTLQSEYDERWDVSHTQYKNFTLKLESEQAGYVAGAGRTILGAEIGKTTANDLKQKFGTPLTSIQLGITNYRFANEDAKEQLVYKKDGYYIWYFIDRHNKDRVRAVKYVAVTLENEKKQYYVKPSDAWRESEEKLMVLLMNQSRVEAGLQPLIYDKGLTEETRAHSQDMADNHYFSHTGLNGSQPQDRMKAAGYTNERLYAENLAYGQVSTIFAHEGLMNSLGHRENILRKEATHVGVGIAYDEENKPYYTINFYTPM